MNTKTVVLTQGLKIGETFHKEIQLREPTLGDMMDAEDEATVATPIAYRAALLSVVMERAGDFTGPFTKNMLRRLTPVDYNKLSRALSEFDSEGEAE